jgi:hypothetical protein
MRMRSACFDVFDTLRRHRGYRRRRCLQAKAASVARRATTHELNFRGVAGRRESSRVTHRAAPPARTRTRVSRLPRCGPVRCAVLRPAAEGSAFDAPRVRPDCAHRELDRARWRRGGEPSNETQDGPCSSFLARRATARPGSSAGERARAGTTRADDVGLASAGRSAYQRPDRQDRKLENPGDGSPGSP